MALNMTEASELVTNCENDLGRVLKRGEVVDLLLDNWGEYKPGIQGDKDDYEEARRLATLIKPND